MTRKRPTSFAAWFMIVLLIASLALAADVQAKPHKAGKDKDDKNKEDKSKEDKSEHCRPDCTPPSPPPPPCPGNAQEGNGTVVFTFDDGLVSHVDAAALLETHGYCGTFYVIAGFSRDGPWYTEYLSQTEVQSLSATGHDIESHTMTHADLTTLSPEARMDELVRSQAVLEDLIGKPVRHFAYPFGAYNAEVIMDTAAVYDSARGAWDVPASRYTIPTLCVENTDTVEMVKALVDLAVATDTTIFLCFHDISASGSQFSWTPEAFHQLVDYVQASGATVRTHAQMGEAGLLPL